MVSERYSRHTHVAFSDESSHNTGRYRSLGLVTAARDALDDLTQEATQLLASSGVRELKWSDLSTAKDRFAAEKIITWVVDAAAARRLAVDALVWDTHDERHAVKRRDDVANLHRMSPRVATRDTSRPSRVRSTVTWTTYARQALRRRSGRRPREYSRAACLGSETHRISGVPELARGQHVARRAPQPHHADGDAPVTNAFNRDVANLADAVSLRFMYYNFARPHMSLAKPYATTPAMSAGVSDHVWKIEEIATRLSLAPSLGPHANSRRQPIEVVAGGRSHPGLVLSGRQYVEVVAPR